VTRIVLDLGKVDSDMPDILRDTAKRHREGRTGGYNMTAPDFLDFIADQIEHPSPLIVLDLEDPAETVRHMRSESAPWDEIELIADQIEAQTKPARIPEPGLWGVVEASSVTYSGRRSYVRDRSQPTGSNWIATTGRCPWANLIDPTLIREGVEA